MSPCRPSPSTRSRVPNCCLAPLVRWAGGTGLAWVQLQEGAAGGHSSHSRPKAGGSPGQAWYAVA